MVQAWLQRVAGKASAKNQSRFMSIMIQIYFFAGGLGLGLAAWDAPSTGYGLILVKLQAMTAA